MTEHYGYSYIHADYESVRQVKRELRILDLEYCNNYRIASSWIGGPHGWVNWDGAVGCTSYNIGKWPSASTVLGEWKKIAQAFPYLDLTCQLWSGEVGEEGAKPVIQFRVKNGKVTTHRPKAPIAAPDDSAADTFVARLLSTGDGERGCTIEQLTEAVAITRKAIKEHQ